VSDRVRLFVAADLPPAVRAACAAWRDAVLRDRPALRPVADPNLHVTLSFLGWRDAGVGEEVAAALAGVAAPARDLALGGARWLPPRRPRVLALEIDDRAGGLGRLRAAVAAAVEDEEPRPFLAHVTVARARGRERVRPEELPPPRPVGFDAAALTLYRSRPGPGGSVYEPLWRATL
jgi:RNA 2',3'-cyclic 3'-phosphodiesterase